ncbi:hypothetical protein MD484_g8976, partial [Candolleomyces efflorescens]
MRTRSSGKEPHPSSFDRNLDEQKDLVLPELGEVITLEDDAYPRSLYHHLASKSAIADFLKKSRSYSLRNRRWKLPRSCAKLLSDDFHTPFLNIVSSIIKHFWGEATVNGSRMLVDTHSMDLAHCKHDPLGHASRPSFVIKAEGPSFQLPDSNSGNSALRVGFSNVTTCIELQPQHKAMPVSEQLARVAIYARQIFMHQPNRRFVRLLVLSEDYFRLFHFDRSGAQYSPCINFHEDPHTFVRLILGVSSPDESDIGLDSSIQWTIENGRKVEGTLTTRSADGVDVVYPLVDVEPLFCGKSVCGRATICWRVRDPASDEELVVKDSWKSEESLSEHVYLQDAIDVPGVVQMVSCEHDRSQTRCLRGFDDATPPGFHNRVETRIVMKAYGKTLRHFTSVKELLYALRDAIAGHRAMYKKGTLHRDISLYNILLGKPETAPGYRGILIDFDMAIHYSLEGSNTPENWLIGTRHFQSIAVLSSSQYTNPLPRDHLDDLESFFYVLAHILMAYDPQGEFHGLAVTLQEWDDPKSALAATSKAEFLSWESAPVPVEERWPIPCSNLLVAYQAFLYPLVTEKMKLNRRGLDAREGKAKAFADNVDQHYTHVLRLFDEAIDMLDEPPESWKLSWEGVPLLSPLTAYRLAMAESGSPLQSRSSLKRMSDGYPDDMPPAKCSEMRTRSSAESAPLDPADEEKKRLVLSELEGVVGLDDDVFIRSLYHHLSPESAIDSFLRKSRAYNSTQRRWKLPRSGAKLLNEDFYTPFLNIISSIIKHFWEDSAAQGTRQVVDTHSTDLRHREAYSVVHHSRPSLVIKAQGSSFQLPHDARPRDKQYTVGYSNITSCFEIQLETNDTPLYDQLVRVAIYARQIFIQQPNRLFVRIIALGERHLRLFHFDPSGAQYTPLFNFHDNPHTFVRLVLGLSSPEETDIGLDDSIKWTTLHGRKVSGTLEIRGANDGVTVYPLTSVHPLFSNGNMIRDRTICWSARDPTTGENLVIKDSWRSEERMSEHLFLQDAVGVAGVVQMVAREPDRRNTKSSRGLGNLTPADFKNRMETRIVMKAYGKCIMQYKSAKQLFCALRDAIAGMNLFATLFSLDTYRSATQVIWDFSIKGRFIATCHLTIFCWGNLTQSQAIEVF